MATKTEIQEQGKTQAAAVINNAFIDGLTTQLNEKCKYGMSFPKDYNLANALTGAYLVLKETTDRNNKPILESCTQASVANSLMDMATLGLSVQKKQGYFIAYGKKCLFQRSYFGNVTIARRYGLEKISSEVIYEGDHFEYAIVDGEKVLKEHTQDFNNINNDKIVGAYAVLTMNDGQKILEVMNINQIKQAWKQGYACKEGSGVHAKFTDQMAKKTVMNRALKQIINTHGDVFVQEADERTEEIPEESVIEADVREEVETGSNQEEFIVDDVQDTEEAVEEVKSADDIAEEVTEADLPDFMVQEDE